MYTVSRGHTLKVAAIVIAVCVSGLPDNSSVTEKETVLAIAPSALTDLQTHN